MKQRILVIFTGGTIGSKKQEQGIDVYDAAAYDLIHMYQQSSGARHVELEPLQPLNLLSENLIPDDWLTLIACLKDVDFTSYRGIIITHGSDTIPYTAACISFVFRHSPIPIVLTASNFPLDHPQSNGLRNFTNAIDLILDRPIPGIFTVFENDLGESVVYLGTRMMQSEHFTDQFPSTYSVPFGHMKNQRLIRTDHPLNPTFEQVAAPRTPRWPVEAIRFSSEILYIKPYPGLNYKYYDFTYHKPKAVLHDLFHSGTACTRRTDGQMTSLSQFIDYCQSHEVDVYICPIKNASGDLYASSVQLIEAGAIPIENTSMESALVKLMLAYGMIQRKEDIRALLNETLFFEHHGKM